MAGIFSKHRFQIWHAQQHPFKHNIADFAYTNPAIPGASNLEATLDWLVSVFYPLADAAVADPASLPLGGDAVTFSVANPGIVNIASNPYTDGDHVQFLTSGTLPSAINPGQVYFVQNGTATTFTLSTDKNGLNPIQFTDTGSGAHTVENVPSAYRVVQDDGDGKAASYRWQRLEGEASYSWHKVYDMDWSQDSVLAAMMNVTNDLYVYKQGKLDLDPTGVPLTGIAAGQHVYGGDTANTHLTLHANSGDGVGPDSGYVQVADDVRPTTDATKSLGTPSEQFLALFLSNEANIGTTKIQPGSITDSGGAISFDNEDLTTTGAMNADTMVATTSVTAGDITISGSQITSTQTGIDFDTKEITNASKVSTLLLELLDGVLTSTITQSVTGKMIYNSHVGTHNFSNEDIEAIGTLSASTVTATTLNGGNLRATGNTLSSTNTNGNIAIAPNGTGIVDVQKAMQTLGQTVTGVVGITGQLNADNLRMDGNTLSSTDTNGDISLSPNGTGTVTVSSDVKPTVDNTKDLGAAASRWNDIFLGGNISDGSNAMAISTLLSLRDINTGVAAGMAIFWNGTKWVASAPDTEIDHGTITGLADDDHTQYALLAGRAGGQSLVGGTAASEALILESTSNGTKGQVKTKDDFAPYATATWDGSSWSGKDLGTSSLKFRDINMAGEAKGLRAENTTTENNFNTTSVGRLYHNTTVGQTYSDGGTTAKYPVYIQVKDDSTSGSNATIAHAIETGIALTSGTLTSIATLSVGSGVDGNRIKFLINKTGGSVTLNNSGNIQNGGTDIILANNSMAVLVYEPTATKWYPISGGGGGSAQRLTATSIATVHTIGAYSDTTIVLNITSDAVASGSILANGTKDGQRVTIYNKNATYSAELITAGNMVLVSNAILYKYRSISFVWDNTDSLWIETGRN